MSDGIKRAALALSALGPDDREWILHNLDQAERDRLESALAGIDNLGAGTQTRPVAPLFEAHMQADGAQAPAAPAPAAPASAAPPALNGRQRLIHADAGDVMGVLGAEPDWMVAAVCGMWQWHWLPDLLRMLGEDRAQRVERYMRTQPDHSGAVLDALTEVLGKRLEQGASGGLFAAPEERPVQVMRPRGRLASSFSRLTSWLL